MQTFTLISACAGDRMPEQAVDMAHPSTPISWSDLSSTAQDWATSNGYGDADDELLYVVPGEVTLEGWPTLHIQH
jgi:hypothetical protein